MKSIENSLKLHALFFSKFPELKFYRAFSMKKESLMYNLLSLIVSLRVFKDFLGLSDL